LREQAGSHHSSADADAAAPTRTDAGPGLTPAAFTSYIDAFNRNDYAGFADYYTPDVTLVIAGKHELRGREAIAAFYQNAWSHLREHLVVRSMSFERGQLIVSLQNTIEVFADYPDFPPRALKKGEHYIRSGTITYDLHAGRFVRISDGNH
jgi:hypothetical protein